MSPPALKGEAFTRHGWVVCLWTVVTSFQFGYHISALNQIQAVLTCNTEPPAILKPYSLPPCIPMSDFTFSLVTSIFTFGGLTGSNVANLFIDRWGRKGASKIATGLIAFGTAIMGFSSSTTFLLVGRFLIGFGSGIGLCVVPIFLAEISPVRIAGNVGVLTQMAIVIGIFFTQVIGLQLATPSLWRYVLFTSTAISVLQLLTSPFISESPTWLLSKGRYDEQREVAQKLWQSEPSTSARAPLLESGPTPVDSSSDDESDRTVQTVTIWQLLTSPEFRKPLIICCSVLVGQQLSGINAVLYYSNDILSKSIPSLGPYLSLAITIVNVLMTLPPIILIERMGRKRLLAFSIIGALVSLLFLGYGLDSGAVTVSSIAIVTFVMFFAVGLGPIPFVMVPEVSPPRAVSALPSFAFGLNWLSNFLVGLLFLPLRNYLSGGDRFKEGRIFYLFALLLASFSFVLYRYYR